MTWAPSVTCMDLTQVIAIAIAAGGAVVAVVALPLAMVLLIRRQLVSPRTQDHEEFVQLKEIEYVVCYVDR